MSRIGKKPIPVPSGTEVKIENQLVTVKGKAGELKLQVHPRIRVRLDEGAQAIVVERPDDERMSKALHGLTRSLINNMVQGTTTPFERKLEIVGVGYQASIKGKNLELQVGYANIVRLPIPANVQCEVPDNTHITLRSTDKQAVGQFAAEVRRVRPPEPYKGKGIRYQGEQIRRKAGKAFGSA